MTLVKLLTHFRRLINELDVGSLPNLAFTNLMHETVEEYHWFFGVKTRVLVQQIIYAAAELPGDDLVLHKAKSEITSRLERSHLKVSSKSVMLQYTLPLDDQHLEINPPMRRMPAPTITSKSTQTEGKIHDAFVRAFNLE